MANGRNDHPFCDRFHVTSADAGLQYTWRARPVISGHFAMLPRQGVDLLEVIQVAPSLSIESI